MIVSADEVYSPGAVSPGDVLDHSHCNRLTIVYFHRELQRFVAGQCRLELFPQQLSSERCGEERRGE